MSRCKANPCCGDPAYCEVPLPQHVSGLPHLNEQKNEGPEGSPYPRSAHRFSAIKPAPVVDFRPTHRRIETGGLVELIISLDNGGVKTYPTMYPGVIIREPTGQLHWISEEVWDQRKKKKLVNYEPLED